MEKMRLTKHKQYFSNLWGDNNKYVLIALLVTTFLAGWREGKSAHSGKKLRGFVKFMVATTLATIRHRLFLR